MELIKQLSSYNKSDEKVEENFEEFTKNNDKTSQLKTKKKGGGFQSMNLIPTLFKAIMGKGFNVPTPIQVNK